jgi:hypothetical protein
MSRNGGGDIGFLHFLAVACLTTKNIIEPNVKTKKMGRNQMCNDLTSAEFKL